MPNPTQYRWSIYFGNNADGEVYCYVEDVRGEAIADFHGPDIKTAIDGLGTLLQSRFRSLAAPTQEGN